MGIKEKLAELELQMARTQKNKATEGHLGILKSKIAKLRTQLLEPEKGPGGESTGFEVTKYGDARIALIGFPSVGKSTALSLLTGTESEAASYEFTTLTCIPGIIHYKGTKIQLLDLPGIIEGAASGKGRGRQVSGYPPRCRCVRHARAPMAECMWTHARTHARTRALPLPLSHARAHTHNHMPTPSRSL